MAAVTESPSQGKTLAVLFVLAAVGVLMATLSTPLGRIKTTTHADKHAEAEAIRQCFQKQGAEEIWQDDEHPSIRFICVEMESGDCPRWGVIVAQVWPSLAEGCDFRERSVFQPRNGAPERVRAFLENIATRIK